MSTSTTNYKLIKPAEDDDADISVINANMDAIDTVMMGLDNCKEGLIRNTMEKATLADEDAIPLIDSADSSKTKKISFISLGHSLKSYFDTLYNKTVIVNNLTTTEEGSALDAMQGKKLADNISLLNTSLSTEMTARENADTAINTALSKVDKAVNDISPTVTLTNVTVGKTYTCTDGTTTLTHTYTNGDTYKFVLPNRGTWITSDGTHATSTDVTNTSDYFVALYNVYGVKIDITNSNPETAVTYTDDAVGMTGGSVDWDGKFPFNVSKPCLLKNGTVNYYLDPTNYTKRVNGASADITTGSDGDIMIEVPKGAYLIYVDGNYMYVKITGNPDAKSIDLRYGFYAHTRDSEGDRDKFYVGAYLGYSDGSKLRSLSGKTPTTSQTIGTLRTLAQANGTGYDLLSFYPLMFLQCCYLIRYKSRDSQSALGRGYTDGNSAAIATGGTNAKGMFFGETTGKLQMKFCGIEDFWGNLSYFIDGLFLNASWNILTAFNSFNNTGSGYTNRGQVATTNVSGYPSKTQGTTNIGFIPKELNGSNSTYYSDISVLIASRMPYFGGSYNSSSQAGAFMLVCDAEARSSLGGTGARLMYL